MSGDGAPHHRVQTSDGSSADYETWKAVFDTDPVGRKAMGATRHRIYRDEFEPNHFYLTQEFPTPGSAKGFLDHPAIRQSWEVAGAIEGRVLEEVESVVY